MHRLCLTAIALFCLAAPVGAQTPVAATQPPADPYPRVTVGVMSFLQFSALLHEADNYNAFDVTRGYLDIHAQLSDRLRFRFTPDVRPTTDADLATTLTLRLEYASLYATVADRVTVMFGLHETPWLAFEESVNRYRAIGPFFAERVGLIPGPTDVGISVRATRGRVDMHAGVYNGEGYGRAERDKYKNVDGRVTIRPFANRGLRVSGAYQHGWYARDRPRHVGMVMASYEQAKGFVTAQYLTATDNPFASADLRRRGVSVFGEVREGLTGWAGVAGVDLFDPDAYDSSDFTRRIVFGGAHWRQVGRARLGLIVTLDQSYRTESSQVIDRRLLAQTHMEF